MFKRVHNRVMRKGGRKGFLKDEKNTNSGVVE